MWEGVQESRPGVRERERGWVYYIRGGVSKRSNRKRSGSLERFGGNPKWWQPNSSHTTKFVQRERAEKEGGRKQVKYRTRKARNAAPKTSNQRTNKR